MYSYESGVTWRRGGFWSRKTKLASLVISLAAAAALIFAGIAGASNGPQPTVTVDALDGQSVVAGSPNTVNISVPMLPASVNVDGTAMVDQGNMDGVQLEVSDNGTDFYGPTNYWAGSGNVDTAPYSVPWSITSAGSHTIVATVSIANNDGTYTVVATVTVTINVTECPAAPAIAAGYMQAHNVKSGSGQWKTVINDVAHQTGSSGQFWAAHSCDQGYAASVTSYIHSHYGI